MPFEGPGYICYRGESCCPLLGPPDWVDSQIEQVAIHWRLVKDKAISTCKHCLHLTQLDSRMTRAIVRGLCVLWSWLMFDYQLNVSVLHGEGEDGIKMRPAAGQNVLDECESTRWFKIRVWWGCGVLALDRWPQAVIWLTLFLACLYLHVLSADGRVEGVIDVINY